MQMSELLKANVNQHCAAVQLGVHIDGLEFFCTSKTHELRININEFAYSSQ